jgi:hypothetical protein
MPGFGSCFGSLFAFGSLPRLLQWAERLRVEGLTGSLTSGSGSAHGDRFGVLLFTASGRI